MIGNKLLFKFLTVGIFVLCSASLTSLSFCMERIKYTGTFSSLKYHSESGDLLGVELRIAYTKSGYQATVQIAEGVPEVLILVPVFFDKQKVRFEIPDPSSYAGGFEGRIDTYGISGVLKFKSGGQMELRLPRKNSYWE